MGETKNCRTWRESLFHGSKRRNRPVVATDTASGRAGPDDATAIAETDRQSQR
jgi:hypothetical protein